MDDLVDFVRGSGFVLGLSDTSFAEFFASELKVNIDEAARLGVDVTEREQGIHDALGDCRILARCLPLLLAKLKEMV